MGLSDCLDFGRRARAKLQEFDKLHNTQLLDSLKTSLVDGVLLTTSDSGLGSAEVASAMS